MALPHSITNRLRLPVVAAPMLTVSGPELVIAACQNGVIGSFPTANARTVDGLDGWLTPIARALADFAERNPARSPAPFCPNLIIRRADIAEQMGCLVRHKVELLTRAFTGLDTNMLRPSIAAAGPDPAKLPNHVSAEFADAVHGGGAADPGPLRWRDIWSAGHSIAGVTKIQSTAELIEQTRQEYAAAQLSMPAD